MSIVRTRSFLPSEGGYGRGGGDEGWLKKSRGVAQPKGRNNCSGHRFTSGSVVLFWPGGGPTPPLTIKGVSRLTASFKGQQKENTHSQTFKTFFPFCPSSLTLHTANGITFHADFGEKKNFFNYDMVLKFTITDWSHCVVTNENSELREAVKA